MRLTCLLVALVIAAETHETLHQESSMRYQPARRLVRGPPRRGFGSRLPRPSVMAPYGDACGGMRHELTGVCSSGVALRTLVLALQQSPAELLDEADSEVPDPIDRSHGP